MNTKDAQPNTSAVTPEHERWLDAQLKDLRASTEVLAAPAHLETSLMSVFKAHHKKRTRSQFFAQWFAPGFALAASAGMSAWMVLAPMAQPALDSASYLAAIDSASVADTPFIALQSLEQIAIEPRPRLIETDVPRVWLASYGVAVSPESASDSLRAEMLVSASGQPLAMRFLP
ncbi:MAG: hypothetical protein ABI583_14880 [Betaproteobacteria bacterium]